MYIILNDELYHFGIKGQKWGVRRFQNADGSLKPAGKKRYDDGQESNSSNSKKSERKSSNKNDKKKEALNHPIKNTKEKFDNLDPRVKKALAAATAVTLATVLLSKNAHKNDAKQRIKRTEKKAKYAERGLNRFQL